MNRQVAAMACDQYEVGIRDSVAGKMMIRTWAPDELIKSIPWLRRMNARRNDIYIRPAPNAITGIVLVDDLDYSDIEQMRADGYEPTVVVETSPKNFQAWIRLGADLPRDIRTEAARFFAKTYGSDPNSADWRHFGRLAGFTNRKPEYSSLTGQPWCLLEYAKDLVPGFIAPASKTILEAVNIIIDNREKDKKMDNFIREAKESIPEPSNGYDAVASWYKACAKNANSPSEADWILSTMAFDRGYRYEVVVRFVRDHSPGLEGRKAGHVDDYLDRTVGKAEIWSEFKRSGAKYADVKDVLLSLARERSLERSGGGERSEPHVWPRLS